MILQAQTLRSPGPRRFQKPAIGSLELAETRALYVGEPLGVGLHRSAVTCVAVALGGTLTVSSPSPRGHSGRVVSALIGAGLRHRIEVNAPRVAFLYLDPADAFALSFKSRLRCVHELLHVRRGSREPQAVHFGSKQGLASIPLLRPQALDPRIGRVLELLRSGRLLDAGVAEVAAAAQLSASHFMHLFRAHAGVPFRRYRLWARLGAAVRHVAKGANWTEGAIESAFASSSHLSDTFRSMFGVAPSVLHAVTLQRK